MKRKILISALIISFFIVTGCDLKKIELSNQNSNQVENNASNSSEVISLVKVIINDKEYLLRLEDNETARDFANLLPKEFNMDELNGNEKYVYLDKSLTTNSYNPGHIEKGDVMLFGDNCLVIFYKSFDTSYSYTKIGYIDNLDTLNNESIMVKFEK